MTEIPWPQHRDTVIAASVMTPRLAQAWAFSKERLAAINRLLLNAQLPVEVVTVAVSGSLSRMEAHAASDLDLLIVIDDRLSGIDDACEQQIAAYVWSVLDVLGIQMPKTAGIFSRCVRWSRLVDENLRGIVDEDIITFGQRMQLLADAQPVVRHEDFSRLQSQILAWYSEVRIGELLGEAGVFHWLWQDVQRYWRSLRSRSCWLYPDDMTRAIEVNLKLRSSRLVIVAAFLKVISEAHAHGNNAESQRRFLAEQLRRTPLERLAPLTEKTATSTLIHAYETIWQHTSTMHQTPGTKDHIPHSVVAALRDLHEQVCRTATASDHTPADLNWVF